MMLALSVGRLDVDEMLAELSYRQFVEWLELYQLEPWGELREDWRSAQMQSTVYNVQRTRGMPRMQARDFLLRFGQRPAQTDAEMWAHALAAFAAVGVTPRG